MTIVNEDSRVANKLKTSITDDARVIIYDRHMFIVQGHRFHESVSVSFEADAFGCDKE
jgi:hypothetical protein